MSKWKTPEDVWNSSILRDRNEALDLLEALTSKVGHIEYCADREVHRMGSSHDHKKARALLDRMRAEKPTLRDRIAAAEQAEDTLSERIRILADAIDELRAK